MGLTVAKPFRTNLALVLNWASRSRTSRIKAGSVRASGLPRFRRPGRSWQTAGLRLPSCGRVADGANGRLTGWGSSWTARNEIARGAWWETIVVCNATRQAAGNGAALPLMGTAPFLPPPPNQTCSARFNEQAGITTSHADRRYA